MYEEASQVANDAVGSIRTVASFCAEKKVMELYQKKCDGPVKKGVRLGLVSGAGFGFSFFILYCTNAFCFYIGSILVQNGKATFVEVFKVRYELASYCFPGFFSLVFNLPSNFVQVFFSLTIAAVGVSQSSAMSPDSSKAKDSAASIFSIIDRKSKIDSSSDAGTTLAHIRGDIELEHISFKYPLRPHVEIFRDLSLSIPSGKVLVTNSNQNIYVII